MKRTSVFILTASLLIISSCSTSTLITSKWKAPDVMPGKYEKVMVLGIMREEDRTLRIKMEDHLVGDLKSLGYNAFSAYQEYGPKTFEGMNEQQANKKLAAEGIDAVVTVVLLNKQKEKYYVPGRIVYSPYAAYHDHMWTYYHSLNYRIGAPDYYTITTNYFWESNLYDLKSDKLIFSVQTQSFDPASTESLAHEYGQKMVQTMVKDNVLVNQEVRSLKTL